MKRLFPSLTVPGRVTVGAVVGAVQATGWTVTTAVVVTKFSGPVTPGAIASTASWTVART